MEHLKKALTRMGLEFTEGNHTITQYGTSEKAEIKLDNAVGFSRQEDGTFAMVGDFWHSKNKDLRKYYGKTKQFDKDISTSYAIEEAKSNMEAQNFFCTGNEAGEVGQDGLITMTFESWS
jgi:hypothetical protein